MEGKIRGQRDRKQEKQTEKNEKRGRGCVRGRQRRKGVRRVIIPLLFLDAEMTFDPIGPQVRKKQAESFGKHMDSIYPLHMSIAHRCRYLCRCSCF